MSADCRYAPDANGEYQCDPRDNRDGTATCAYCGFVGPYADADTEREILAAAVPDETL